MSFGPAKTRSDLLSLLTQACELEHGLACSYLFTAFTLKSDIQEGLTWEQQQMARRWAAQILFVASQEMLHLAQAWNLLSAIGGSPYYLRPNFPQGSRYYPLDTKLALEPFGMPALQRFLRYEQPQWLLEERGHFTQPDAGQPSGYRTVAELYSWILAGFRAVPASEIFIGDRELQVGPDLVDFPNLVPVDGLAAAETAISRITHQGEGTPEDRIDCHFGIFYEIVKELQSMPALRPSHFAREVVTNPRCHPEEEFDARGGTLVTEPYTKAVSELFDDVYGLMLRALTYPFGVAAPRAARRELASLALRLMVTVLKPLGESLTQLPVGPEHPGRCAGPTFGLTRHVTLPINPVVAQKTTRERLLELASDARRLLMEGRAPARLVMATQHLTAIASAFGGPSQA